MPSKIETHLSPEQFIDFCRRCAQLKGGTKLATIQALAEEYGVSISLMAASTFRDGALSDYLAELKSKREMAEQVADMAKGGLSLSDAAASAFAAKLFDAAVKMDPEEIGGKSANNISLAITRLRSGDQRAKLLEPLVRQLEQKIVMQRFDAAALVLQHAKEIKLVIADNKLDTAAKTDRVAKILWGEKPADFKAVGEKGSEAT